jgi:CheY-like chemotaxis protein
MMTDYKTDMLFGSLTGNGRVLVVDNEPTSRTVVRSVLEKAGYDGAGSGQWEDCRYGDQYRRKSINAGRDGV